MKKFIKITGIVILAFLILLIALPFVFQGKIIRLVKDQINNNLNAKADFDKLSLSLFRSFPNVSVGVKKLYIAGINEFEADTLFSAQEFEVVVDLISAIKLENIKVKRIFADKPRVYARILPDGRVNWDIVKDTGSGAEDTTTSDLNPRIELKRFELRDAFIRYNDEEGNLSASLQDLDFVMTGDLSQDFSTLSIHSTTGLLNLVFDRIRYLKDASLTLKMDVDADLKNSIYTLRDNTFNLNDSVTQIRRQYQPSQ